MKTLTALCFVLISTSAYAAKTTFRVVCDTNPDKINSRLALIENITEVSSPSVSFDMATPMTTTASGLSGSSLLVDAKNAIVMAMRVCVTAKSVEQK